MSIMILLLLTAFPNLCTHHHGVQELLNRVGVPFVDGKSLDNLLLFIKQLDYRIRTLHILDR